MSGGGERSVDERARALAQALVAAGTAPTDAAASERADDERAADAEAVARAYLARRQGAGRDLAGLDAVAAHLDSVGRACTRSPAGVTFAVALGQGPATVEVTWAPPLLRLRARRPLPPGVDVVGLRTVEAALAQPVWRIVGAEAELSVALDLGHAGVVSSLALERAAALAHAQLVEFDRLGRR